jgi:hypothetical protein
MKTLFLLADLEIVVDIDKFLIELRNSVTTWIACTNFLDPFHKNLPWRKFLKSMKITINDTIKNTKIQEVFVSISNIIY